VHLLCIIYPSIRLTTEKNTETVMYPKGARLKSAGLETSSGLGHRVAVASTGPLTPIALGLRFRRRGLS